MKSTAGEIYIKSLKHRFPEMIITDHFDESLLMLKRRYCWELQDIAYVPLKVLYSTLLYSTLLYSSLLYSATQHNTTPHSAPQHCNPIQSTPLYPVLRQHA